MPRLRFNPVTGTWVEVIRSTPPPRVHLHTDSIDPLWHPADGQYYDSKSAFRAVTRAHDCVEMGTTRLPPKVYESNLNAIEDAAARAVHMVEDEGYRPPTYGGKDPEIDAGFETLAAAAFATEATK